MQWHMQWYLVINFESFRGLKLYDDPLCTGIKSLPPKSET